MSFPVITHERASIFNNFHFAVSHLVNFLIIPWFSPETSRALNFSSGINHKNVSGTFPCTIIAWNLHLSIVLQCEVSSMSSNTFVLKVSNIVKFWAGLVSSLTYEEANKKSYILRLWDDMEHNLQWWGYTHLSNWSFFLGEMAKDPLVVFFIVGLTGIAAQRLETETLVS